ncbi:citrate lyase holo-[acyl-carrier protein] synthase [Lachnotalea glycerini]|uniref:citrate lyase holo-[acyl-carrier protein] synthase n=1 Tax=Lachnotalea glycerini TaxID=1763509 RepID=A0A371JK56_9FIRM|nr:citrate lyase holo-[acyl-carrier protein] synthase [Lachnotalea glycerini]RDY33111.1 citrate lyase holo-[acyl-carrier protein] synthase [Lachnotalea glycerini]
MKEALIEITLEQMLQVREERVKIQNEILEKTNSILITFTMNIPGPIKNNKGIEQSFIYGKRDLIEYMKDYLIKEIQCRKLASGGEAYLVIDKQFSAKEIKSKIIEFEETHPIGRWFDIDVKSAPNRNISRAELGIKPRKCFLCNEDAKVCGRSRRHSIEELYKFTNEKIQAYVASQSRNSIKTA